ncbi:uncharacterized protein PRCAT00005847001 [Priceomyces carsonii]|uniref:uncharacterized protein n=1 Tax=Priceomyces carsonii TaxID=28549 RepID=UPI002ED81F55|nr:unnamed protein product [Priceomyces carsonii]
MPSFTTISQESSSSSSSTSDLEEIKERTVFERIKFIYCKDFKSDISIKRCYDTDFDEKGFTKELELAIKKENDGAFETFSINLSGKSFLVWQIASTDVIRGVVTESFEPSDFDKWFLHLVASTSKVDFSPDLSETSYVADIICDEFVATLKKTAKVDKWDSGGREFFKEGIEFFVTKGITIEAVLPAFPCKSSNSKKVATSEPDKGEELAIRRLIQFAHNVKKIYPPGMIVWIVSDGHVFSDCIGVDDDIVDEYTEKVKNLYSSLDPQNVDEVIKFASLKDIFNFQQFPMKKELVEHVHLEHYLSTKLDDYSELCRKVLVHSCDTDSGKLREDVNTKDHPRLFLYRGFSKFMTEDLASHPVTVKLTRKKFRKVVSRIAFEMIKVCIQSNE